MLSLIIRIVILSLIELALIRPGKSFALWILYFFEVSATFAFLYFTDSISDAYWWFAWIVRPLCLIVIFYGSLFVYSLFKHLGTLNKMPVAKSACWFENIPSDVRCQQIELVVGKCLVGNEETPLDVVKSVARQADIVAESQLPAYYVSLSYVYMYLVQDKSKATILAESCLALLSCYNKNDLFIPAYQWISQEPTLDNLLFKYNGEVYRDPMFVHYKYIFNY